MCLAPDAPAAPPPPAAPQNYEAVESKRSDERKRRLAAYGTGDTRKTGPRGLGEQANTGKTVLGA